jgi:hypothetical protein
MTEEILILKTIARTFRVKIGPLDLVTESELPILLGKRSASVWRWARRHLAKVYNGDFLPVGMRLS